MFLLLTSSALSASGQTDTNDLPPLVPAYGEIPPTYWQQHGMLVLAGGSVLLALAGWAVWQMLQPKPVVVLPRETVARQALARLQSQPEDGNVLSAASQILRRYIVAVLDLPPGEMTTAEFCSALAANGKINEELAQSISEFLRKCDQQKFSSSPATAPLNAAIRALELLENVEKRRVQIKNETGSHHD